MQLATPSVRTRGGPPALADAHADKEEEEIPVVVAFTGKERPSSDACSKPYRCGWKVLFPLLTVV